MSERSLEPRTTASDGGAGEGEPAVTRPDEPLLRELVKHTPAAVAMLDRDLRYILVSDRWLSDYQLVGEDLVGRSHYEVFPDIPDDWKEVHQRALAGAVERREEDPFVRADGSVDWLMWEVRPWHTATGAVGGLVMLTQVITERKRAEAEREQLTRDLEERVKELTLLQRTGRRLQEGPRLDVALLTDLVALIPAAWQYSEVCEARISCGDVEAKTPGFCRSSWHQVVMFTTAYGERGTVEVVYLEPRPHEAEGPFLVEERRLLQSFADMLRCHAERKHSEDALAWAEQRFSSVFLCAPVGMLITNAVGGEIVQINDEFEGITGYARGDVIGRTVLELGLWIDPTPRERLLERAKEQDGNLAFELPIRVKGGAVRPLRVSARLLDLQDTSYVISAFVDLTEQKRIEASIRASEARLRRVVEAPILGFAFGDESGAIREANDEYLRIIGYSRADLAAGAVNFWQLCPPEYRAENERALREVAESGTSRPWEMELIKKDGGRVPVFLGVSQVDDQGKQAVAFVLDLTERRALERQLRQAQKMEAVGRLAAGIAHDFNNVLSAITISTDLLHDELGPAGGVGVEYVTEIRGSADRAAGLIQQLLAFSRQQVLKPRVLELNRLLMDFERMLGRVIGAGVVLRAEYDPLLGAVRADPGQIQQVVLNLVVNARDAMPKGGTLVISTANVEYGAPVALGSATMPPGSYVALTVTDSGVGMDPQVKLRIFDPFFTTKEPGKGTGLGLATVYGIVQQSGGAIEVETELGKGTSFRVVLPRVDAEPEPITSVTIGAVGGKETVLLVEVDAPVRRVTRKSLARLGYRVLEAASAAEAREISRTFAGVIDVVLADLTLPQTTGRALADELCVDRPSLRVVLMPNDTGGMSLPPGAAGTAVSYLPKPFSGEELARCLRSALDAPRR